MSAHTRAEAAGPPSHGIERLARRLGGVLEWARHWTDRRPEPGLSVYVFGKHPAWADFIDVAQLPPVPAAFRHLHDRLRNEIEVAYADPASVPRLMLWRDRRAAAVLLIHPSHDSGRRSRVAPLLTGMTAAASLGDLTEFARPRLCDLAAKLFAGGCSEGDVVTQVNRSVRSWRDDFAGHRSSAAGEPPCRADIRTLFRQAVDVTAHATAAAPPQVVVLAPPPRVPRAADVALSAVTANQLRGMLHDPSAEQP